MKIETDSAKKIPEKMVISHLKSLSDYKKKLNEVVNSKDYSFNESSLKSPFDKKVVFEAKKIREKYKNTKLVLLVGIGGSDLGTKAVYNALRGHFANVKETTPKLVSFDTIETEILNNIKSLLEKYEKAEDVVLIVISKSGSTTETIMNANILFETFSEKFGRDEAKKQTIVISGENSDLYKKATSFGTKTFSIPQKVGGRFSVFTNVGLIPLSILGFDIESFASGAKNAIENSTDKNKPSGAGILASFLFEAYLNDARIHELFIWKPELETLGKWYRQLLAESIGKEKDDETKIGIIPTIALGSTDLHSVGQLIFGGRNDRFTTFISSEEKTKGKSYTENSPFELEMLTSKNTEDVMNAILKGVENTYKTKNLPYLHIKLNGINERELGLFMALQMTKIMFLAKLFEINAFDQPAVEFYKEETRKLLQEE